MSRPEFLGDEHWRSIDIELVRLHRSLESDDHGQVIGDIKCLVEAIARVALDIAGIPADPGASFDSTVSRAHELLAQQPGHDLTSERDFARLASQASRMARNLGNIRNQYGGGHGRARHPRVRGEMVDLALDGGLIWSRWALRRLGLFSEGRPDALIRDLVDEPQNFYSGTLTRRLEAANLPNLEERHQRALGVAVAQRCMRGTFVVRWGGLDPCLSSDDLSVWPAAYRIGLTHGLWFDPNEWPTVTATSIREGLTVLDPVPDCSQDLDELVQRIVTSTEPGLPGETEQDVAAVAGFVRDRVRVRPEAEQPALARLADHIERSDGA